MRHFYCLLFFLFASFWGTAQKVYNVRDYGAKGSGKKMDSPAIQKAIDVCTAAGGGTVVIPRGTYLSATILLKDNVTLRLDEGALLLGIPDLTKYDVVDPFTEGLGIQVGRTFIAAIDAKNIAIEGTGVIDGQGSALKAKHIQTDTRSEGQRWGERPFLLRIIRCQGVRVENVTLKYSASWTSHYGQSRDITINNVKILSVGVAHNDGINIDGCERVTITGCDVESGDDALCFKTTHSKYPCRDVTVRNMRLKSNQAGIKMGTESMAPFENIKISNCHIYDTKNGGIKLFSVDGAHLRNIEISDITMDEVRTPMMFRLGARLNVFRKDEDTKQTVGIFENVIIRNVNAIAADSAQLTPPSGILITGIPDHYITNLTLENIHIRLLGTGTEEDAKSKVPEAIDQYPEVKTFGPKIPAYGVWARHVKGLKLKNVTFELKNKDMRPEIICEDGDMEVYRAGMLQTRDYTFGPEQVTQIKQLLGSGELLPGDRVVLEDGTYTGWDQFDFYAYGTPDLPVTFKAQNPGKVIFSGAMGLRLYGEHLLLDGFVFRDAWAVKNNLIDFRKEAGVCAYYSRMTNCVIDDCNDPAKDRVTSTENWIVLHGTHNRIDHCYFARKWVAGIIVQVWLDANGESYNNYHRIDHNFFGERAPLNANGAEIFRIGHSWSSQFPSCSIVEDNVFYHCDGENETISVKSCRNIVRRNLFYENRGSITLRHGHNNLIESNVFIGNNLKNTMGIRVINQGHKIYNNYLQDITGTGSDAALVVRMGVYEKPTPETDLKKEPLVSYHRVTDVDIAYNTLINCALIEFGQGNGDKEPRNVRFANNLISNSNVESNITISNPAVFPGIKCFNNYVSFRDGTDFRMEGFTLALFSFEKPATGTSKGLCRLRNEVKTDFSVQDEFNYIRTDATGSPRTDNSTPGAVQFANQNKRFNIVRFDDCGPIWYDPLKKDFEDITQKTTF